jgi:NitT/TauT family transport system substrate-binding protein
VITVKNTCDLSIIIALIILATVTGACVSPASPALSQTPESALTTVRVAYMPIISFGPLFIAQEEGYFARQGIHVEFEKFPSTSGALPSLIKGDIAVSAGNIFPGLINAVADGAHIRIVADKGIILQDSCNSQGILVRRDLIDSGMVRTVADLRGRRLTAGSDQSYPLTRGLALGNLTENDVGLEDMPRSAIIVAFENRAVDAAFLMEPYLTQALKSNNSVMFLSGYDLTPNFSSPLMYGPAFTDTNPELGRRFMVAYLEGVRQYNQGKTERNLQILSKYTQLDRDALNETCWVTVAENGEFPVQPVSEYIDWMYATKKISSTVDTDQLIDMSYARYASSVLGNSTATSPKNV